MARKRSLAEFLYTDAREGVDVHYRELMRSQDRTPVSTDATKPRFTLVVGPSPFTMPRGWEFFLTAPYEGATYISTVLHNAGFPVKIVDVRYAIDPLREAYDAIKGSTDVLGVCTFEDNFPFTKELIDLVKTDMPEIPIICGGSLVTSVPHVFMHHTKTDIAVISEGEITILELMERYHEGRWDEELSGPLGVPLALLPEVRSCAEVYAKTAGVPGLPDGVPIAGMAGDQQAALFGQTCYELGDAKCTYGTGAFLLQNVGESFVASEHGLVTTIAWRLGGKTVYALEGSSFIAGAAVQWLRDGLGLIASAAEIEAKAREVESAGDVVFVPALAGLGAPHWDPDARGLICGLSRDTTAAHLCRATLDGIAFQIADLVQAMNADVSRGGGRGLSRLRVDGGAAQNDLLMQFQCDILGVPVDRPANIETTALGAAYLAGLGAGVFADLGAIQKAHRVDKTFDPAMAPGDREREMRRWRRAVARTRSDLGAG